MLMKIREKMKGKEQGFTLIELIVVLAILAVLALLAMPRFASILEQSRLKTHNQNIEQIAAAVELYAADHTDLSALDMDTLVAGNYLKENPEPPYSGASDDGYDEYVLNYIDEDPISITIEPCYASFDDDDNLVKPAAGETTQIYPIVIRP